MDLPKYQLSAENSLTVFEFVSIGEKGHIKKLIKFSETHLKDFYNLGFGDKNEETNQIDDKVVSNNGDSERVLATVVSAVYAFTDKNPEAWVYATYDKVIKDFEIYGLIDDQWYNFEKGTDFDAFVIRRLKK